MESAIRRARKLLALSMSTNPNEAKEAALRARALMRQHGLTEDDVSEAERLVIDRNATPHRIRLAQAVALSRSVDSLASNDGQLALRGGRVLVRDGRLLYVTLCTSGDRAASLVPKGAPPEAAPAWREMVWSKYVEVVSLRLLEMTPAKSFEPLSAPRRGPDGRFQKREVVEPTPSPAARPRATRSVSDVAETISSERSRTVENLADRMVSDGVRNLADALRRFQERAEGAAITAGMSVKIWSAPLPPVRGLLEVRSGRFAAIDVEEWIEAPLVEITSPVGKRALDL